eukprot:CAMPEP_0178370112 /NCGR_PEP_ID=MMETSP0689_2-20121128/130_1 /TAXON_ID=160604 /ORGANISM="Amphidinium massartii, Strain CS-259" /LENGTH=115 /DNA_ID=CAMNT_0019989915 /DNA_START=64 /DNA_END=411 /DNA_ORIENTATION=+
MWQECLLTEDDVPQEHHALARLMAAYVSRDSLLRCYWTPVAHRHDTIGCWGHHEVRCLHVPVSAPKQSASPGQNEMRAAVGLYCCGWWHQCRTEETTPEVGHRIRLPLHGQAVQA